MQRLLAVAAALSLGSCAPCGIGSVADGSRCDVEVFPGLSLTIRGSRDWMPDTGPCDPDWAGDIEIRSCGAIHIDWSCGTHPGADHFQGILLREGPSKVFTGRLVHCTDACEPEYEVAWDLSHRSEGGDCY